MIEFVSATRFSEDDFWNKSALGLSLRRITHMGSWSALINYENIKGLPEIYNAAINSDFTEDILIFVHDDVWIDDYFITIRIVEALKNFDVVGVAGNQRRVINQPAWAFIDDKFTWDEVQNQSGSIAHGVKPFGEVSYFGEIKAECELLDGVFLAARKSTLKDANVFFDSRFNFHFYDMDFCRSAREKGLRLGTWPICLTHQSGGAFGSQQWRENYQKYLDKWKS